MEKPAIKVKLITAIKKDGGRFVTVSMSHWPNRMTPRIRMTMDEIKSNTKKIGSGISEAS